jgi:lipopolysaccharide transport system ATP-binding protein
MQDISKGEGRTVLFVSHNMAAVKKLCTRGVVLENGTIGFLGNVDDSIQEYLKVSELPEVKEDFSNRIGSGLIKIIKTNVYGKEENLVPQTSKKFHICLSLESSIDIFSKDIRLDLKINDQYGQRVAWLSNWLYDLSNIKNPESILFTINSLKLNAGRYYISTDIYFNKDRTDWLQNYTYFDVLEGDYYKNGKALPIEEARVLFDFNVSFK